MSGTKKVKYAVFPVGGLGTRFLPATKSTPKEMLPVVDKPLIQYAFEQAIDAGVEDFIFITGRNKSAINNHFDSVYELEKVLSEKEKCHLLELTKDWVPEPGRIAFIRQQHPLGLGHAIFCARNFIGDNPFLVMLADELLLSQRPFAADMIDLYSKQGGGNVIGVADVDAQDVHKYGIIDPMEDHGDFLKVKAMVEKPSVEEAPSNTSIIGHYILEPEIFEYLRATKAGKGGEIQLTDALNKMAEEKQNTHAIRFKGKRFDCGSQQGFLEANVVHALERDDMHDGTVEMIKNIAKEYNI